MNGKNPVFTVLLIITIVLMFGAMFFTHYVPDSDYKFQMWSLLPPLVAILLAFVTRQVFLSLFLGVFIGSAMLVEGNIISKLFLGYINVFSAIIDSVSDKFHAGILIFTLTIGGMIGVIAKMGGTRAIANALAKKAKTPNHEPDRY